MNGRKFDGEKPKMYLLPPKALIEVARVLTFGANKYDENNWKKLDNLQNRYTGASLRHIFAHMDGEELDNETGLDHLAHAICCLLFKLEAKLNGTKSEEEGWGEPVGQQYQESYTVTFGGITDYEKTSVRNAEYSVQYDPLGQDNRGVSRTQSVCQTEEESVTGSPCFEYRDRGNGYSLSTGREFSGYFEDDLSESSVREERDRASRYSVTGS
jgi:hypothetical protein